MYNILIIDDDDLIRDMLVQMMELDGFSAIAAEDGEKAQKLFDESDFDLVITDLIMPIKEGVETIVGFKKQKPEIPIIAISGGAKVQPDCYLNVAKQLGAKYTFAKPFGKEEIMVAVRECLKG